MGVEWLNKWTFQQFTWKESTDGKHLENIFKLANHYFKTKTIRKLYFLYIRLKSEEKIERLKITGPASREQICLPSGDWPQRSGAGQTGCSVSPGGWLVTWGKLFHLSRPQIPRPESGDLSSYFLGLLGPGAHWSVWSVSAGSTVSAVVAISHC